MEFNNIGLGVAGYAAQDDFISHQHSTQHLPDCQMSYLPLDQCAYCYRPNHNDFSPQPVSHTPYYQPNMQLPQRTTQHRTWAEIAGNAPLLYTTMHNDAAMADASATSQTLNYPLPQNDDYDPELFDIDLPQTGQKRTYAEVAQYANHLTYNGTNNNSSQHLHPTYTPQGTGVSDITRVGRTQYRQQHSGVRSRSDRRSKRNTSPMHYQYSNSLPYVQEGAPDVQHMPIGQPRNVADLVQATQFGGHRAAPPSSYLRSNSNNHDEPLSPGSHSIASSSMSRRSSRRKGNAMKDPTLPHKCIECRHTFAKLEDLKRHISRAHADIADRPYRCDESPTCPWAFVNPKDLRRHRKTHGADQERHVCPYTLCGKSYTRADNLTRHVNRYHVDDSAYLSMSREASDMSGSFEQRSGYFDEAFEG